VKTVNNVDVIKKIGQSIDSSSLNVVVDDQLLTFFATLLMWVFHERLWLKLRLRYFAELTLIKSLTSA
jgi:hypothetical protein